MQPVHERWNICPSRNSILWEQFDFFFSNLINLFTRQAYIYHVQATELSVSDPRHNNNLPGVSSNCNVCFRDYRGGLDYAEAFQSSGNTRYFRAHRRNPWPCSAVIFHVPLSNAQPLCSGKILIRILTCCIHSSGPVRKGNTPSTLNNPSRLG